MFDKYKEIYKLPYKVLNNEILNDNISHAFLFEIKNDNDYEFIISFIKEIFSLSKTDDSKKINDLIDQNIFDNLKIIETDTKAIKKEQIIELKNKLKNTSYVGEYKIYMIKEAEKLNDSSANTLLKFLEEPEKNIIGILIAKNIYNVIPTVLSRCQCISLRCCNENKNAFFISKESLDFVNLLEKEKYDTIAFEKNIFKEMEYDDISNFLQAMLFIYRDVLNMMLDNELSWCNEYKEQIKKIMGNNDIISISQKINVIINTIESNNTNINKSMLFDKLIIEMSGGINNVKC